MRRRLLESAFINGAMHEQGHVFEDNSEGPHRRTGPDGFAYHPQFEEIPDIPILVTRMSDRLNKFKELADKLKAGNASMDGQADDLDHLLDSAMSKVNAVTGRHTAHLNNVIEGVGVMDDVANILSNALPNEESKG